MNELSSSNPFWSRQPFIDPLYPVHDQLVHSTFSTFQFWEPSLSSPITTFTFSSDPFWPFLDSLWPPKNTSPHCLSSPQGRECTASGHRWSLTGVPCSAYEPSASWATAPSWSTTTLRLSPPIMTCVTDSTLMKFPLRCVLLCVQHPWCSGYHARLWIHRCGLKTWLG